MTSFSNNEPIMWSIDLSISQYKFEFLMDLHEFFQMDSCRDQEDGWVLKVNLDCIWTLGMS